MTIEELQAQVEAKDKELAEAKNKIETYQTKLGKVDDLESFTALKSDRDNLKSKIKTFESEIETLKKNSNGDEAIKKLLADKEAELANLNSELTTVRTKAQKADELEADIIKELMGQLPDDENIKALATGMEIPKLRLFVKTFPNGKSFNAHNGQASTSEIKLTEKQKKEAREMFPFSSPEKQEEYYIHAKKIKGN